MKKTSNFFVIHNYNTIPTNLTDYCEDYIIYDCSDKPGVKEELEAKGLKFVSINNTGHNITSYFDYFDKNYDKLPEVICLCKGNMIGRHCSKEYFNRVYDNKYFTYLYENKNDRPGNDISFLTTESQYVELNNNWYVESENHPHWYFDNYNEILKFIYKDPVLPRWTLFSPGACYIVRREQILKHSREFYRNLCKIMNYDRNPNFPSEAHQIERMLPVIFEMSYEENEWMNDEKAFEEKLVPKRELMKKKDEWNAKRFKRLRLLLGQGPDYAF